MSTVWFLRIEGALMLVLLVLAYAPSRNLIVRFLVAVECHRDPLFRDCRRELWCSVVTGKLYDHSVDMPSGKFWGIVRLELKRMLRLGS